MSARACLNCDRQRDGSFYDFHFGTRMSVQREVGFNSVTTTTRFALLGSDRAFVCRACAQRRMFLYCLPLLLSIGCAFLLLVETPFAALGWTTGVLLTLAVAVWVLSNISGVLTWEVLVFSRSRRTWLRELGWWGKGAVFAVATCLGPVFLMHAVLEHYSEAPPRNLLELVTWPPVVLAWGLGVCLVAQLAMLVVIAVSWPVLMETYAWRLSKRRLRDELDEPRLLGFNSAKYQRLVKAQDLQQP